MSNDTTVAPRAARPAALAFIFITVLIDVLAFGVIIPVLPQLIKSMAGNGFHDAANWIFVIQTTFAAVQFVFTPIQGALSDRFGRRRVILISCLGLGLDFILMAYATWLPLLLVARLISGATSASFSTANAYIADVVPPERRAGAFGRLGAAFGIGFVLGPAFGGFLGHVDLRLPFLVSAVLALANFLYGYFVLPESLPVERRTPHFDWKRANPIGALAHLSRYRQVFGLLIVVFLTSLAHYVLNSMFALYADYRYQWKELEVGFVLGLVGVCNIAVQAFLVGRLVPRFGAPRMLLVGLTCGAAGFAVQGLASSGTLFLLSIPLLALWGFTNPSIQSLATRQVDPGEQGRLQGAIASLASLAGIFGPALYTQVFNLFTSDHAPAPVPGASFLVASLLLVCGLVVAWQVTHKRHEAAVAT